MIELNKFSTEQLEQLSKNKQFLERKQIAVIQLMKTLLYSLDDAKFIDVGFRLLQRDVASEKKELTKLANNIFKNNDNKTPNHKN
jgi:hypothetical protein